MVRLACINGISFNEDKCYGIVAKINGVGSFNIVAEMDDGKVYTLVDNIKTEPLAKLIVENIIHEGYSSDCKLFLTTEDVKNVIADSIRELDSINSSEEDDISETIGGYEVCASGLCSSLNLSRDITIGNHTENYTNFKGFTTKKYSFVGSTFEIVLVTRNSETTLFDMCFDADTANAIAEQLTEWVEAGYTKLDVVEV